MAAHNHGHSNKKFRRELFSIAIGAALLAAVWILTTVFTIKPWIVILLFLIPYLFSGAGVLIEALEKLTHGQLLDEDFLMSIASIGAICIGEYPEAVAVMLFYRLGEAFEHYAVGKSRRSIAELMKIRPEYACVEIRGKLKKISPDRISVNDIIVVSPGEKIPLDGIVVDGESTVDTSALTGESMPQNVGVGQKVISGCINLTGLIRVKVSSRYENSTVSKILELVQKSSGNKSKRENFITRFARIYTPVVVLIALILAIVPPIINGEWAEWIRRALIFLVISCPCALVVSVPLTFFSGIGGASKCGVLIKGSNYLEALADVSTVVLDKTGTVTEGSFSVTKLEPVGISRNDLITFAAAAESYSNHPIAYSLRNACPKMPDSSLIKNVREIPGRGVSATVCERQVLVGNLSLMNSAGIKAKETGNIRKTVVHVAVEGRYCGYIIIDDRIKSGARDAIRGLHALGVENVVMLTGDNYATGRLVGEALGVNDVMADLLPGDKVAAVEEIMREMHTGTLLFVGDGVNDAPVLARSDVGVAMGVMGSDAAIEAADVVIIDDDIRKIPFAMDVSYRTLRIAKQNIVFSLAVKFAIMILGVLGLANMWLAVLADVGVLIIAVLNATRALSVKYE